MSIRLSTFSLLLLSAAVLFSACGSSARKRNEKYRAAKAELQRQDSLALKIAVTPTLDCLPIIVAADSGIFQQLGLAVSIKQMTSQIDCDEAMRKGEVECMVSDLMRTERLRRSGIPLDYVTATNTYWQMFGNQKGRIKEIKHLGDKMIAMSRYSATDYLATLFIDSVKPSNPVFRVQINDVNVRLMMLVNNTMDAAMLTEPQATAARLQKHNVLMDSRQKDITLGVIAAHHITSTDPYRKEQLQLFVEGYNMACDSINTHGATHYSKLIEAYCKTREQTVKSLPKLHFPHATPPRQKDIDRTRNVSWKTS